MKGTYLGEFEELVLLIIGALADDAYSISIKEQLKEKTERNPSIGALHSSLSRLEDKGFISSFEGGATKRRGGRRKRFYQITSAGRKALSDAHTLRSGLFKLVPGVTLNE
ncbi:MAG: helix-turn-helix transcriptional regulator [Cyclobacteriaceae bacterium]|nr:helix-turn-helix transcriptional regulator [Cyclobacteriaceae bacterium HetDA_MAG_MS6]